MSLHHKLKNFRNHHEDTYVYLVNSRNGDNHYLKSCWEQLVSKGTLSPKQVQGIENSKEFEKKKVIRDKKIEDNKTKEPTGTYVGTLKKRYDMVLKFVDTKTTNRGFYIHNFVDREGNNLMCFSNDDILYLEHDFASNEKHILSNDDCFSCRATVNRHTVNIYTDTPFKQTVLNRIKYNKYLGNKRHLEEGNL
ncbi:hypothetical protein N9159_00715 [bacterium]|nr:hypothetical protein [bacterium]